MSREEKKRHKTQLSANGPISTHAPYATEQRLFSGIWIYFGWNGCYRRWLFFSLCVRVFVKDWEKWRERTTKKWNNKVHVLVVKSQTHCSVPKRTLHTQFQPASQPYAKFHSHSAVHLFHFVSFRFMLFITNTQATTKKHNFHGVLKLFTNTSVLPKTHRNAFYPSFMFTRRIFLRNVHTTQSIFNIVYMFFVQIFLSIDSCKENKKVSSNANWDIHSVQIW